MNDQNENANNEKNETSEVEMLRREMRSMKRKNNILIPLSIFVGALVVAAAVVGVSYLNPNRAAQTSENGGGHEPMSEEEMREVLLSRATDLGVEKNAYLSCMESEMPKSVVNEEYNDATAHTSGTPYNILIAKDGSRVALPGTYRNEAQGVAILSEVAAALHAGETGRLVNEFGLEAGEFEGIPAPSEEDHIRGSLNADVVIVEYSDFSCPWCQIHHGIMKKLLEKETDVSIAWVYRHLPITNLHPHADIQAYASECIASLAENGEEAFWAYADQTFGYSK